MGLGAFLRGGGRGGRPFKGSACRLVGWVPVLRIESPFGGQAAAWGVVWSFRGLVAV